MAQKKKPRKIKDLKARLGKTITPNQAGGGPGAGAGGGVVPPAAVGGLAPPGIKPPPGIPAPRIGRKAAAPFPQPTPAQAPPGDPFAAAAPSAARANEVRIVLDDSAVSDSEIGRRKKGLVFAMLGVGALLGLVFGGFAANMNAKNKLYNHGVDAGDKVYAKVRSSADTIEQARRFVASAVTTAAGDPAANQAPAVDFQAIEGLRALEHPIPAESFSRENYILFDTPVVDQLFELYNNVNELWRKFESLAARTLPDARRTALNESAEATQQVVLPTGCVPMVVEEQFVCALVFLAPGEEPGTLSVRAGMTSSQSVPKKVFNAAEDQNLAENANEFVIVVDPERSIGRLGQQASEFANYAQDLQRLEALVNETAELRGELESALSPVAALEERFAF